MVKPFHITAETRIFKSDLQCSSDLDGITVILSVQDSSYLGVNPVGSQIWKLLDENPRLSELVAKLTAEYIVEPQQCEKDVRAFLEKLYQRELIHLKNSE